MLNIALVLMGLGLLCSCETTIVQISDTQFGFYDENSLEYESATYTKCVNEVNELHPDAVVLTGDLVHNSDNEEQWKEFERITALIDEDIPVFYIPGNHDVVKKETGLNMDDYYKHLDKSRFVGQVGDTYLIGIDTNPIKDFYGSEAEQEQFSWIEDRLKENNGEYTPIIFTHHPFFLKNFDEEEGYFQLSVEARKKYFDLFERYGVKAVFSGHLHANSVTSYKSYMPVVTTSAIGRQLGEDESGYRVITVRNGKVSHKYVDVLVNIDNQEDK